MPLDLPSEIHILIIESLAEPSLNFCSAYRMPSGSLQHLNSVALVSKAFNDYANRIIYRKVVVGRQSVAKLRGTLWPPTGRSAHLANYVHSLMFQLRPGECYSGSKFDYRGGREQESEVSNTAWEIAMVLHATAQNLRRLFLNDMDLVDPTRVVCFHPPYGLGVSIQNLVKLEEFIGPRFKNNISVWQIHSKHLKSITLHSPKLEPTFIFALASLGIERLTLVTPMLLAGTFFSIPTFFIDATSLSQLTLLLSTATRSLDGRWVSLQPEMIELSSEDRRDCVLNDQAPRDIGCDLLEQFPKHHVFLITKPSPSPSVP